MPEFFKLAAKSGLASMPSQFSIRVQLAYDIRISYCSSRFHRQIISSLYLVVPLPILSRHITYVLCTLTNINGFRAHWQNRDNPVIFHREPIPNVEKRQAQANRTWTDGEHKSLRPFQTVDIERLLFDQEFLAYNQRIVVYLSSL